jgi:hypothetical protein
MVRGEGWQAGRAARPDNHPLPPSVGRTRQALVTRPSTTTSITLIDSKTTKAPELGHL